MGGVPRQGGGVKCPAALGLGLFLGYWFSILFSILPKGHSGSEDMSGKENEHKRVFTS